MLATAFKIDKKHGIWFLSIITELCLEPPARIVLSLYGGRLGRFACLLDLLALRCLFF